jgi:hypothetical protein
MTLEIQSISYHDFSKPSMDEAKVELLTVRLSPRSSLIPMALITSASISASFSGVIFCSSESPVSSLRV